MEVETASLVRQAVIVVVLCLSALSCGSPDDRTVVVGDVEPLHGSALIIAEHLIPIAEDEPQAISSPSFQRHFKRLGRIELADSVVLGSISRMQVDSRGRLLILDSSRRDVLLFNPDGSFIKALTVEACHPGFPWQPRDAVFSPNDEILVIQHNGRYVLYDVSGSCVQVLDLGIDSYRGSVFTAKREIFSFAARPDGYFIRHINFEGRTIKQIGEQTRMKNLVDRYLAGGLVQDDGGRLYLGTPVSSQISVYDTSGAVLGLIGTNPAYYREIEADLPDGINGDELRSAFLGVLKKSSIMGHVYLLDNERLLLQISNTYEDPQVSDRSSGLHIMSTTGETLTEEPVLMPTRGPRPVGARDGLVYFITEPVEDENGDWGNQGLEVYRFIL